MGFKIRQATEKDIPTILFLYAEAGNKNLSIKNAIAVFNKTKTYPAYKYFLVEENNIIIGVFSLLIMHNLAHEGAPSGTIDSIAVDSAVDAVEPIKCMINFALERCQKARCYKLTLSNQSKEKMDKLLAGEDDNFKQYGVGFSTSLKPTAEQYVLKPFFGKPCTEQVKIRPATAKDLPSILNLYAQPDMDNGKILSVEKATTIFNKMKKKYPNYMLFVATFEKDIVGTFALLIVDRLANDGQSLGIVEDVMVNTKLQGKGIGKSMMSFAKAQCNNFGCHQLVLSSNHKRVAAHAFYKSLGFEQNGVAFLVPQAATPLLDKQSGQVKKEPEPQARLTL